MKDTEEKARAMKVVEPSSELDHRIARLLSDTSRSTRPIPFARRNIPLWACTAACVVALCVGLFLGRSTLPLAGETPDPPPLIYVIDHGEVVRGNIFDWTFQEDRFLESGDEKYIHVAVFPEPDPG